jgi:hypothetical protein
MAQWKQEKKELEAKLAELEGMLASKPKAELPPLDEIEEAPKLETAPRASEQVTLPGDRIEVLKAKGRAMGVTKPWEQMDSHTPWKMDMLKVTRRRPGFVPRWVAENKIEQRMAMGYTIADRKDYETFQNPTQFGSPEASYLMRDNLVLMEIPVEGYEAYNRAHHNRVKAASEDARKRVKAQAIELAKEQGHSPDDFRVTDDTKTVVE